MSSVAVAVQSRIDPQQRAAYYFPTRRGRDTVYQSVEEIMRLNDGSRRSIYLRLRQLLGPLASGFHLRSTMSVRAGGPPSAGNA